MTASLYDLQYSTSSPQEKLQAMLKQIVARRKSMSPNPADGFLTTGTHADSDAAGAGDATTAPGATSNQN
jgi:hypothetical protein